jgi:uncharacterized membrane protein
VTAENWALVFHLLGAFLLFAGATVAAVAFEAARRSRSTAEIALLLGLTRIGVVLLGLGSVLVLAFGLWLVQLEHVGYGAGWVDAAIGLFVLMMALGGLGGRAPKRARLLAEAGRNGDELRRLLDDRAALAFNYVSAALAVAIVVLMVFKPGGPGG